MQRIRKRLWTATVATAASLLIMLAVLVGGVRLLDLAAPGYREKLAGLISNLAGRRVTIEHMGLGWQGLRPRLELSGVVVQTQDGRAHIFSVRELVIPFSWLGLVQGEALPVALTARGLTLGLEWRADGSIGIRDLSQERATSAPLDLDEIASFASRLERVLIEDSTVEWLEPGGVRSRRQLTEIRARLKAQAQFYTLHLTAQLPPEWGESVMLQAEAAGDLRQLETLRTHATIMLEGVLPQYWLAPYLRPDLELRGGAVAMELRAEAEGFELKHAQVELAAVEAEAWSSAADAKAALFKLPGPSAAAQLTTVAEGWDLNVTRLQYGAGVASLGKLSYRPSDDGFGSRLEGEVDRLDLAALTGWLAVLAPAQALALPGVGAAGELTQLKLNYQDQPGEPLQYLLEFDASGVSLPATEQRPGFSNISGKVTASEAGGRFEVHTRKASAQAPKLFAAPVPLGELDGLIRWARETGAWAVNGENLRWREPTLNAEGKFFLRLPDAGSSPYVDIALDFSGSDARPAVALIPLPPALPQDVGDWLRTAVQSGRVTRGRMEMRGTLADFPYANPGEVGRFLVDLEAEDATLEYAPGWPKVEQVKGRVLIEGRSLRVEGRSGRILGVPLGPTLAEIPDLLKAELLIRGTVQSDVGQQLKFLEASPLREDYAGLLGSLVISGPGELDLDLRLPLADFEAFTLQGRVDVKGGQIRYRGFEHPLTEVVGRVAFDRRGLRSEQLDGKLLGLPFSASLQPQVQDGRHYTQLEAVLPLTLPRDAPALEPLVDAGYLASLAGSTLLRLRSLLDINASAAALELSSDLQGMAVNLGTPFGKTADGTLPLQVALRPTAEQLRVEVNYGASVFALLKFMPQNESWAFERGVIKLGTEPAPVLLSQAGLLITGKLPELDLRGIKFQSPAVAADSELKLRGGELEVGLLHVAGQHLRNIAFQIVPTAQGWQLRLSGQDAAGMINWVRSKTGRGHVDARLEKLVLQPPKTIAESEAKQPEVTRAPVDPGKLPGLLLEVSQIKLGGLILGRLLFDAPAIDNGLRLQTLKLAGKNFQMNGDGEWIRSDGASSARLQMQVNGTNIRRVLKAAGFAPSVVTEQAKVGVNVTWAPNPAGLSRESLNGVLALDLHSGALLDVDPGAGRVLGLLSFYSLPRRLTLDFRDVLGEGTQFDRLSGNFSIKDGVATTHDLEVESPSLKIEVDGDVDLAERTYDQTVTIHAEVSSGVAIAGALAGGPALGVALLLAQRLFGEPVEDLAALSYHLGGTWEEPEVKPLSAQKRESKADSKRDKAAPQTAPTPAPSRPRAPTRP
ncbi:MAG: YhdP family protein [Nevskiales bacterium]